MDMLDPPSVFTFHPLQLFVKKFLQIFYLFNLLKLIYDKACKDKTYFLSA